jgi:hypothetical protein
MSREIKGGETSFLQALLKLIPSEVIAVFIFIQGVIPRILWPHLLTVGILMVITPLYLARVTGVRSRAQLVISTLSLAVWIYAMNGGPVQFIKPPFYEPWYGAVALAVWTLIPPMFLSSPPARANGRTAGRSTGRRPAR